MYLIFAPKRNSSACPYFFFKNFTPAKKKLTLQSVITMEYMRTYYPEIIKSVHPKYGTVINADDVRQQREKEDAEPEADLFRG